MQCSFMCHSVIMISLLSTAPQCQMPEFRKSSYYSSVRIALSLLLCRLLQHKQQLSLNAVNECLVYKQLFLYPGLWVKAAEGVPLVETFCSLMIAAGCMSSAGTDICITSPRTVCITGGAPQENNLPRLWDLLDAPEQFVPKERNPSTELNLRYISGCVIHCLLRKSGTSH